MQYYGSNRCGRRERFPTVDNKPIKFKYTICDKAQQGVLVKAQCRLSRAVRSLPAPPIPALNTIIIKIHVGPSGERRAPSRTASASGGRPGKLGTRGHNCFSLDALLGTRTSTTKYAAYAPLHQQLFIDVIHSLLHGFYIERRRVCKFEIKIIAHPSSIDNQQLTSM